MKKNVALLAACQALMMSCSSLVITTAALVGFALAPDQRLATLPAGLQFFATMLFTFPASLLMKKVGRRGGFLAGAMLGICGAVLCTIGIFSQSFSAFCAGIFCIGAFNATGQYYRFAAADAATEDYRSRAISLVLAGGLVAAFVGPNLANWTRSLFHDVVFAGSYASLIVLYVATAVVLSFIDIPRPSQEERDQSGRSLHVIALQPRFVVAVLGAMVAYGVMNLLMTATPLAMDAHGHTFGDTAWVIQWHVVGMFAPSFFTGHVIRRLGVLNVMVCGGVLLAAAVVVNLSGTAVTHFWGGLLLLGLGWNFLFVGSTTLLTETYAPAEKAKAQGLNDLLVFALVTLTAAFSGVFHHAFGWTAVNWGALPWIGLSVVVTVWLGLVTAGSRPALASER